MPRSPVEPIHLLGIRHHGPGSAKSVLAELERIQPAAVLVELPSDATEMTRWIAEDDMVPPVALMVFEPAYPEFTAFYPFAEFSPEWVAMRWALANNRPIHGIDLPGAHMVALNAAEYEECMFGEVDEERQREFHEGPLPLQDRQRLSGDPLGLLAEVAGFDSGESLWEHWVELEPVQTLFPALIELMQELRRDLPLLPMDKYREAWMRLAIRQARTTYEGPLVAIVGAWHTPALQDLQRATEDRAVLKGLPKSKVSWSWAPWSDPRLAASSGYGAGVISPEFYRHVWEHSSDELATRWLLSVARLLRREGFDASPAATVEAVRLAEALAGLRQCSRPRLRELLEAAQSVLTGGRSEPMEWIESELILGRRVGQVPAQVPTVPLLADFYTQLKQLKLKLTVDPKEIKLDLRSELDLDRSALFHRMLALDLPGATRVAVEGKLGNFHEHWQVSVDPNLNVLLAMANQWGPTIETAARDFLVDRARKSQDLKQLVRFLAVALDARLSHAVPLILLELRAQSAKVHEIGTVMDAMLPITEVIRYGTVRDWSTDLLKEIVEAFWVRITVDLRAACRNLDDEASKIMATRLAGVQSAAQLMDDPERLDLWAGALRSVQDDPQVHGLLGGTACRLLDALGTHFAAAIERHWSPDRTASELARALSPGNSPLHAASWIEGFFEGQGVFLVHRPLLFDVVDHWLCGLPTERFEQVLPLIRRTFSTFTPAEKRQIGLRVRHGDGNKSTVQEHWNAERAQQVLGGLALLLGGERPGNEVSTP